MPLPTVVLGEGGIRATRLGFGCAGLFRVPDPARRFSLLQAAYEAGLRHFDVAPMYGLGRAESELGRFARPRRGEMTIATKFGIKPTFIGRSIGYAQRPIRRIFAAKPAVRDYARAGPARFAYEPSRLLYDSNEYDAACAKRSLERSLRALNTDYVDLFLLHDPAPGSVRSDEVAACLEDARAAGLIRSWGIAGEPEPTGDVARSFCRPVPIRQLRDDVFLRSLAREPDGAALITYGVIARPLARIGELMSTSDARTLRWQRLIGEDARGLDLLASLLLRAALRQNGSGVVLFSTTRPSRVNAAVNDLRTSCMPDDPVLDVFLELADAELRARQILEREGR